MTVGTEEANRLVVKALADSGEGEVMNVSGNGLGSPSPGGGVDAER